MKGLTFGSEKSRSGVLSGGFQRRPDGSSWLPAFATRKPTVFSRSLSLPPPGLEDFVFSCSLTLAPPIIAIGGGWQPPSSGSPVSLPRPYPVSGNDRRESRKSLIFGVSPPVEWWGKAVVSHDSSGNSGRYRPDHDILSRSLHAEMGGMNESSGICSVKKRFFRPRGA